MTCEEIEDGVPQMHRDLGTADAMRLAGIDHRFERHGSALHLRHQRRRIVEHHIVVRHAVDQQHRIFQRIGFFQSARRRIGAILRVGIAQIALGIVGVVQIPFGDRRAGNARHERTGRLLQQL